MRSIIFTLCLLSIYNAADAQQTVELRGKVVDSKHVPLSGVTIYDPADNKGVVTSDSGTFVIALTHEGKESKLRFSYAGFATREQTVDLMKGNQSNIEVILSEDVLALSDVVVTGVSNPKSKISSSVSISTMKASEIQETGARTTAEVFRSIPGIKAEASGGDGNTNITVRGIPISAGGSKYLQLQEDGLPALQFGDMAFATADQFVRADQTINRIEAIRGGSASTMATNSPAGIINFISKTGAVEGGNVSVSTGLGYGNFRSDFNYGAPIANGLSYNIGGFYRYGEGPRTAGYAANNGGQIKANMTKQFNKGYARVYVKYLNDRTAPYFPMPVKVTGTNDNPTYEALPGFDPKYGALQSPYLLHDLGTGNNGEVRNTNVTDGMHPVTAAVGTELNFDLGNDWSVEDRARASMNSGSFVGAFPASVGTTSSMLSTIAGATGWNLNNATVKDAVTGNTYSGENAMILHMFNVHLNNFSNYLNDFKLKKSFKKGNVMFGLYKSIQNVDMSWNWNSYLTDVNGNGLHPLNIVNANGQQMDKNGQFAYGTPVWGNLARNYNTQYDISAPYLTGSYNVTKALNIDASARWDIGKVTGSYTGGAATARDMNGDGVIDSAERKVESIDYTTTKPVNYKFDYISYSVGANYMLNDTKALFGRYSSGGATVADRALFTPSLQNDGNAKGVISKVDQAELGFKSNYKKAGLFITAFYANINEAAGFEATTQSIIQNHYKSMGLEVEGAIKITDNWNLKGSATYTKAELTDGANKGNAPRRQAPFIFTAQTSYTYKKLVVGLTAFGTTKSYTQDNNKLIMPGYVVLNPYVSYNFAKGLMLSINGNNITNTLGFTESEDAAIVNNTTNIVRARSILGRTVSGTLSFNF